MKRIQIGFLILLAFGLSEAISAKQYAPPISKRGTALRKPTAATGRVITLPANKLPAGAILPPQKAAAPIPVHTASAPVSKPKPVAVRATPAADPWRFYSYP